MERELEFKKTIDTVEDGEGRINHEALGKAREVCEGLDLSEFSKGSILLHFYNFFNQKNSPKQADFNQEIEKMRYLSQIESEVSQNPKIPPIGIELEFPRKWISEEQCRLLDQIGISNAVESRFPGLWEVNPHFSYSAEVQARIIEELRSLGVIPREKKVTQDKETLSLHLNFGIPTEFKNPTLFFKSNSRALVVASSLAFVSPERMLNRKTSVAYSVQRAEPGIKNGNFRFELRTPEFSDYTSYRMLIELQCIVATMFSSLKRDKNVFDEKDKELAIIWDNFYREVENLFLNFGIDEYFTDDDKSEVFKKMNEYSELKAKARSIITKYALQAKNIIFSSNVD
jgi:hypothetical protein